MQKLSGTVSARTCLFSCMHPGQHCPGYEEMEPLPACFTEDSRYTKRPHVQPHNYEAKVLLIVLQGRLPHDLLLVLPLSMAREDCVNTNHCSLLVQII